MFRQSDSRAGSARFFSALAGFGLMLASGISQADSYPQQTITSISPTSGPVGTVITVTGSNFTGSSAAWMGPDNFAPFKLISDTSAQVTVPDGTLAAPVTIINPQTSAVSAATFTVVYPKPSITSFTPITALPGTLVTITGKGFTGSRKASVGTATDASLKVLSDTQAQILVPMDGKTGPLALANLVYSGSSLLPFTVLPIVPLPSVPLPSSLMAIHVVGNNFVDALGATVQLRGVNYSGFEFTAIQGWAPSDPSGGLAGQVGGPKFSAIKAWKANVVRLPLNEASWLGDTCVDTAGTVHNPDPGGNYKAAVKSQVDAAIAAGLYVILDLHWTAPGNACPMLQTQMADLDHSLAFWTSLATAYKNYPAVMFELFNEPYFYMDFTGDSWSMMMQGTGGTLTGFPATSTYGNWQDVQQPWVPASYQLMLDTVRATGATNVVIVGSNQTTQDLSQWLSHRPADKLSQMAVAWHPYPGYGAPYGSAAYAQPNLAPNVFGDVQGILAAGLPVIATETGDRSAAGTVDAPLVSNIVKFADANGVGVIGWTWDTWADYQDENVLIKDVNGTPTDGYGKVFQSWLVNHP